MAKKSTKQIEPAGEAFQRDELKSSLCTKVKMSWLTFIVTWCEECEGRKEEKGEEIKGKAIPPFGSEKKWSPRESADKCSLKELREWVSK